MKNIKPFTLVKVAIDKEILKKHYENLKAERTYLFLDTIKNMPGRIINKMELENEFIIEKLPKRVFKVKKKIYQDTKIKPPKKKYDRNEIKESFKFMLEDPEEDEEYYAWTNRLETIFR